MYSVVHKNFFVHSTQWQTINVSRRKNLKLKSKNKANSNAGNNKFLIKKSQN